MGNRDTSTQHVQRDGSGWNGRQRAKRSAIPLNMIRSTKISLTRAEAALSCGGKTPSLRVRDAARQQHPLYSIRKPARKP